MHGKSHYSNATDLRRTFKTPEGAYHLKSEARHGQAAFMDRQAARMTIGRLQEGAERGEYIILNVGDALHILQYNEDDGDSVKAVYFRRDVYPNCHTFSPASDDSDVLVGLSNGEVYLLSLRAMLKGLPYNSQVSPIAVFNGAYRPEDDVACTAVIWTTNHDSAHFVATYSDGTLRIFDKTKAGSGLEARTARGVLPEETLDVGGGCIQDAAISPDSSKLAVVSKDGVLRVFCAKSHQLLTGFQSYYGGLLCCAWSPDSKYVATGGEDDLVAVFSLEQETVLAFGEGHSSWISQVAFDSGVAAIQDCALSGVHEPQSFIYRVGSVAQDTQVALWDFEVDISLSTPRNSSVASPILPTVNGVTEERQNSVITPAIPHRDMVIIPPVMLHKLHPDPVTDIVFTADRMFTCDYSGHVRYWSKPLPQNATSPRLPSTSADRES